MLSTVNSFFGFDRGCIPDRECLVVAHNTDTGRFLVHQIVAAAVKEKRPVCLVSFIETFHNYNNICLKIGVNLKSAVESNQFVFYDGMEELTRHFFSMSSHPATSPNPRHFLQILQTNLLKLLADLRGHNQMDPVLVVDELSVLLCLDFPVSHVCTFARHLQQEIMGLDTMSPDQSRSSLTVSCTYNSSDSHTMCLWKFLTSLSSVDVNITDLETFYCKDVHGQIQLTWRDGIDAPRQHSAKTLQFKLVENSVEFFASGTSAAVFMAEEAETGVVNSEKLLEHLAEVEGVAEDILADRQKLIDLDRHRNQTRGAVRTLQKDKTNNKQWLCLGTTFIKMEKKSTSRLLDKDFDQTGKEIAKTRTELKLKLNHIRDLEHKDIVKGFNLQPLSKDELTAINDLL